MGMFRQCEMGWTHNQFGNFCMMLLRNTTDRSIEYFCTFQGTEIPPERLPEIANAIECMSEYPDFIDDGQVPTMKALVAEMRRLAAEKLPLKYE